MLKYDNRMQVFMFNKIYKNKRVFITGHSGFKGSWLNLWLTELLDAEVFGYSLVPDTNPSLSKILNQNNGIYADILDYNTLEKTMRDFQPDIIFHLAAQPLVRLSYKEPIKTYKTNVVGTLNVLEAARKTPSVKAFINITTDKCYENKEQQIGYKETDRLGGYDIYSSSKACSEILSASYRQSFLQEENSFLLATARAGNVIGGGDWAKDRLIPDCIRFINQDKPIEIRYPKAIRPWQHVLEPLSGYLKLGQKLLAKEEGFATSFNFGPNEDGVLSVKDIAQKVREYYGKGEVVVNQTDNLHEANLLMLDINKAKTILNWHPTYNTEQAVQKTVEWYKHFYEQDMDIIKFTLEQIKEFERNIKWKIS